jgi:hypothetical protein
MSSIVYVDQSKDLEAALQMLTVLRQERTSLTSRIHELEMALSQSNQVPETSDNNMHTSIPYCDLLTPVMSRAHKVRPTILHAHGRITRCFRPGSTRP